MHNLEIMVLQMSNRERHFSRNMKLSRILPGSSLIPKRRSTDGYEKRHCERSEAIHLFAGGVRKDGLLRFARNDASRTLESQETREVE
jgi:hypothetical protein